MHEDGNAPDSGEKMRYDLLGDDPLNEAEKLEKYSGIVDWQYLKTHFEKGVLLYVDASLQLAEVGKAIAVDDRSQVDRLLKTGDLLKPGPPHAEYWESTQAKFTAMVVSPFILIQPLEEENR